MGIIVGNGKSKLRCDTCGKESQWVDGENDGQKDVENKMQNKGWQCLNNGKTYCPDCAYKLR